MSGYSLVIRKCQHLIPSENRFVMYFDILKLAVGTKRSSQNVKCTMLFSLYFCNFISDNLEFFILNIQVDYRKHSVGKVRAVCSKEYLSILHGKACKLMILHV